MPNILTPTQKKEYEIEIRRTLERIKLSASDPIIQLTILRLTSICTRAYFDGTQAGIDLLDQHLNKAHKS